MKIFKRMLLVLGGFFLICGIFIWGQLSALPAAMTIVKGKAHALPAFVEPRTAKVGFLMQKSGKSVSITPTEAGNYTVDFSALGLFHKTVTVHVLQEEKVLLGGELIGIKMYMDGALVIGMSEIPGTGRAPGKEAGIRAGDRIISVNGQRITDSEMLEKTVEGSEGAALMVERDRLGTRETVQITPVYYKEGGAYKIGLWVRDSTAGVGTMTFIKPESGRYGALGHAITDYDTGETVPVSRGAVTDCRISLIEKGEKGAPGAVQGRFETEKGALEKNTEVGVYGTFWDMPEGKPIPTALSAEIQEGPVKVYTNIAGGEVRGYSAEIERVFRKGCENTKCMCIRITDPALLSLTGGIIQGMSGSPLEQNGKLIGAVTHVFVNDPTRGYGIFIENMLTEINK